MEAARRWPPITTWSLGLGKLFATCSWLSTVSSKQNITSMREEPINTSGTALVVVGSALDFSTSRGRITPVAVVSSCSSPGTEGGVLSSSVCFSSGSVDSGNSAGACMGELGWGCCVVHSGGELLCYLGRNQSGVCCDFRMFSHLFLWIGGLIRLFDCNGGYILLFTGVTLHNQVSRRAYVRCYTDTFKNKLTSVIIFVFTD